MLASLRCQTPSTRRFAPVPETRTLEKPNARNFLAISALSANRSTELRARVAQYRFPSRTVKSPAKLALPKLAVIAKAAIVFSKMRVPMYTRPRPNFFLSNFYDFWLFIVWTI